MLPFLILGGIATAVVATVAALSSDDSSSSGSGSGSSGDGGAAERRRAAREQVERYASDKLRALNERERTPMTEGECKALAGRMCQGDDGAVKAIVDAAVRSAPFARTHERELAALDQERERLLRARAVLETIGATL